jgi:conjugal transfer pilus assembly protein TraW
MRNAWLIKLLLGIPAWLFLSSLVQSKNLGVIGQTYPIAEEDLLSFLERKIKMMQSDGEWTRLQHDMQTRVKHHIDRPAPLTTLTKTTIATSWEYDPSIHLPYDLHDHEGHIFAKAGTTFNPLTMIPLHTAMAFYDADDEEEVSWAKKINAAYSGKVKFVLIKGSVSSQEKILHQPIYFDQEGRLTARFHIAHAPALVYQEGMHLKVAETLP